MKTTTKTIFSILDGLDKRIQKLEYIQKALQILDKGTSAQLNEIRSELASLGVEIVRINRKLKK